MSRRHAGVRLEPLQRLYLPLLDGTRTRDDLVAHALALFEAGELAIGGHNGPIQDRAGVVNKLERATDASLAGLMRLALLDED